MIYWREKSPKYNIIIGKFTSFFLFSLVTRSGLLFCRIACVKITDACRLTVSRLTWFCFSSKDPQKYSNIGWYSLSSHHCIKSLSNNCSSFGTGLRLLFGSLVSLSNHKYHQVKSQFHLHFFYWREKLPEYNIIIGYFTSFFLFSLVIRSGLLFCRIACVKITDACSSFGTGLRLLFSSFSSLSYHQ